MTRLSRRWAARSGRLRPNAVVPRFPVQQPFAVPAAGSLPKLPLVDAGIDPLPPLETVASEPADRSCSAWNTPSYSSGGGVRRYATRASRSEGLTLE
jgi:hypothetical protein